MVHSPRCPDETRPRRTSAATRLSLRDPRKLPSAKLWRQSGTKMKTEVINGVLAFFGNRFYLALLPQHSKRTYGTFSYIYYQHSQESLLLSKPWKIYYPLLVAFYLVINIATSSGLFSFLV